MFLRWQQWNRRARFVLWVVALIGVAAALPLGAVRMDMEKSSKHVEYVFDYRDITDVADRQPRPQIFLAEKIAMLKEAGITTMAVYESSLKDLQLSGRLTFTALEMQRCCKASLSLLVKTSLIFYLMAQRKKNWWVRLYARHSIEPMRHTVIGLMADETVLSLKFQLLRRLCKRWTLIR